MNNLRHNLSLIGSSTGGPGLIEKIIKNLPDRIFGTIIIAQHMNPSSLCSFASRLDRLTSIDVVLVDTKKQIKDNTIYILKTSCVFLQTNSQIYIEPILKNTFYNPQIDIFYSSAAHLKSTKISAYILSGIGNDGANGMEALKINGHLCIAQDKKSSIVYGMPKAVIEINAADRILNIYDICNNIRKDMICFHG